MAPSVPVSSGAPQRNDGLHARSHFLPAASWAVPSDSTADSHRNSSPLTIHHGTGCSGTCREARIEFHLQNTRVFTLTRVQREALIEQAICADRDVIENDQVT